MGFGELTLHPDRDMWEQQPGESNRAHGRFLVYRDMPRHERSRSKVAESLSVTKRTIAEQAKAHLWEDRAAGWDAEQARQHHDRVAYQAERLAKAQIDVALGMTNAVARAVQNVLQSGVPLDPPNAARWLDIAAKVAKQAQQQPNEIVAVTGADGGPIQIEGFEDLTPEEQRYRATEMARGVLRLYHGGDEDDAGAAA